MAQPHDIQITGLVADARQFLGTSMEASAEVAQASLRHTAAQMSGGKTAQVTVFNPHSWRRKEWVEVEVPLPPGTGVSLGAERDGQPVPCYAVAPPPQARGSPAIAPAVSPGVRPAVGKPGEAGDPGRRARAGLRLVRDHGAAIGFSNRLGDRRGTPDDSHPRLELAARSAGRTLRSGKTGAPARLCSGLGHRGAFFAGRIENRDCESRGRWSFLPFPSGAPSVTAREKGEIGGIPSRFRSHRLSRFSTRRLPRSLPD